MSDRTSIAAAFAHVAAPARDRYGVIDPELSAGLLTDRQRKALRRAGLIVNRYRSVDVVAALPRTPEQDLLAATTAVGGLVGGAGRSAAALWRLSDTWPRSPEVMVAGTRRPRLANIVIHRNIGLERRHLTVFRRIPVLRPAVALLSLAAVEGEQVVVDATIRGLKKRLFRVGAIDFVLKDLGRSGRDGTDRLRQVKNLLYLTTRPPDSVLEGRFLIAARAQNLPPHVFQLRIYDARGHFIARVDFAWPEFKLVVEVDGWEERASPEALARELARQNRLVAAGWIVLRFPWWRVVCEPGIVGAEILSVLRTLRAS